MLHMLVAPYLVELLLTAAVLTGQGICALRAGRLVSR